jgi:hypothetical protein
VKVFLHKVYIYAGRAPHFTLELSLDHLPAIGEQISLEDEIDGQPWGFMFTIERIQHHYNLRLPVSEGQRIDIWDSVDKIYPEDLGGNIEWMQNLLKVGWEAVNEDVKAFLELEQ